MSFEEFKEKLWASASDNVVPLAEIEDQLKLFDNIYIPTVRINQTFVARCSLSDPGEVFNNVSRCSYPPDRIIDKIKIQRCNYPGQQVFYCSMYTETYHTSTTATVVTETTFEHIRKDEISRLYVTMSRWEVLRPLKLWALPYCKANCEKNMDMALIKEQANAFFKSKNYDSEYHEAALSYISEMYAYSNLNNPDEKQTAYRITSAFYNYLQKRSSKFSMQMDGLIYPSANTEGAGVNLALNKELIDSKVLIPTYVTMYAVQKLPNNIKRLNVSDVSGECRADENGNIRFSYVL